MKYAFLVYQLTDDGQKELVSSVAATEADYDGMGYPRPALYSQVFEAVIAQAKKWRRKKLIGIELVHPATEFLAMRCERWDVETTDQPAKALSGKYDSPTGRRLFCAHFRVLPSLTIKL